MSEIEWASMDAQDREAIDHMDVHGVSPEVIFPLIQMDGDLEIHVCKLGGGSPDRKHAGLWVVQLWRYRDLVASTDQLHTGLPKSHYQVSGQFAEYLANGTDSDNREMLTEVEHADLDDVLEEWAALVSEETEGEQ